jgi:hypothetical protein
MLNTNITSMLQSINGITNTVVLKYPTTVINSAPGDVIVKIDMSELDSEQFPDTGIFNLNEFLNIFKLFDDRDVTIVDGILNITNKNKTQSASYISTDLHLLEDYNKDTKSFNSTENVPSVSEFTLTNEDIKKIKQASTVFKDLSDVIIVAKDGAVSIGLGAGTNFNAKTNSYNINLDAESSKEFKLNISAENFNNLPNSDYLVKIKYNSTRDAYRILLDSTDVNMQILMAVKK